MSTEQATIEYEDAYASLKRIEDDHARARDRLIRAEQKLGAEMLKEYSLAIGDIVSRTVKTGFSDDIKYRKYRYIIKGFSVRRPWNNGGLIATLTIRRINAKGKEFGYSESVNDAVVRELVKEAGKDVGQTAPLE